MARLGIIGSKGRMGEAIARAIGESVHELGGGADKGGDVAALAGTSDCLIDFSTPRALSDTLDAARAAHIPILIGTTGLDSAHHVAIDEAAREVAVLQTGNTSLGVSLLEALVEEAARRLDTAWDIEIMEMHHRGKVDAPSGTAKLLGAAAARGRGIELDSHSESGRDGITGARGKGAIGFAALRGGSVAGEHSVILAGNEERITLSHSAENRMIFARGAVKAAAWLIDASCGRYTMRDVLGL